MISSTVPNPIQLWSYDLQEHCSGSVNACFVFMFLNSCSSLFLYLSLALIMACRKISNYLERRTLCFTSSCLLPLLFSHCCILYITLPCPIAPSVCFSVQPHDTVLSFGTFLNILVCMVVVMQSLISVLVVCALA